VAFVNAKSTLLGQELIKKLKEKKKIVCLPGEGHSLRKQNLLHFLI